MEQTGAQALYTLDRDEQEMQPLRAQLYRDISIILGEDVLALEHRLADYTGAGGCVAVSDAACGIALALQALEIGEGDVVLCAGLGCAVPVQGILLAGADPLLADINPNTYTIDPYCVEYLLGKLARTESALPRALIATDLFGAPCHYPELEELCERWNIDLIEDLSGAFGARLGGRVAGSFGRFAVASFASPGPLEELGGGAVFCADPEDAAAVASLRREGHQQQLGSLLPPCMSAADTAAARARLERFSDELRRRREVAGWYREALCGRVRVQKLAAGADSTYSQFVVALPRCRDRDKVIERMHREGIPCSPPAGGRQTAQTQWNRVMLVNTLAVSDRLLSLPIHPHLGRHLVEHICACLVKAMDEAAG